MKREELIDGWNDILNEADRDRRDNNNRRNRNVAVAFSLAVGSINVLAFVSQADAPKEILAGILGLAGFAIYSIGHHLYSQRDKVLETIRKTAETKKSDLRSDYRKADKKLPTYFALKEGVVNQKLYNNEPINVTEAVNTTGVFATLILMIVSNIPFNNENNKTMDGTVPKQNSSSEDQRNLEKSPVTGPRNP